MTLSRMLDNKRGGGSVKSDDAIAAEPLPVPVAAASTADVGDGSPDDCAVVSPT